jgi:hypothetical protein
MQAIAIMHVTISIPVTVIARLTFILIMYVTVTIRYICSGHYEAVIVHTTLFIIHVSGDYACNG